MSQDILVREAASIDLEAITGLSKINTRPPQEVGASSAGFLVSGFSRDEYESFLGYADYFRVALSSERVSGFMLAYSARMIGDDEWLNSMIRDASRSDFVLVKQICSDPAQAGKGIASALYESLLAEAGTPVFAVIVTEPRNVRSIEFHEKMGFRQVATATPADGLKRGVWAFNFEEDELPLKSLVES